ncbi:uncharacterized protein METZ01_LOCUS173354 [marine metagenome]|uniref:Sulfotransferase domain-containing protein n=1 Tax=marine metagenome TaxID=408172 RepID=A0A382C375_9ZZZZ
MINLYLGTINRSGGSLFCRLLDGHPDIASYPKEISFPNNTMICPDMESIAGIPRHIPNYDKKNNNYFDLANIPEVKIDPIYKWGKERSDPIGVRKNYLEKEFYGKVKTDFNYNTFIELFEQYCGEAERYKDIWNARHRAYFKSWENNIYAGSMKYVVWHDSGGLYISNHKSFFNEFDDSYWIYPLRDVYGYIASEKTRLARRHYGSRRYPKIKMPNYLVKKFNRYDLNAHINSWLAAFTRASLFQDEYGVNNRFLVYSYKNLVVNTEEVMQEICKKTDLTYNKCLLIPTLASNPWGGSSHQGKQSGINPKLAEYFKEVLTEEEIFTINNYCEPLLRYLIENQSPLLDLTKLDKKYLYDYDYQKRYFYDEEKTAMYSFIINCRRRRFLISAPNFNTVFAYIYSKIIRILHIPRLLKQKYLPGVGKQNYT